LRLAWGANPSGPISPEPSKNRVAISCAAQAVQVDSVPMTNEQRPPQAPADRDRSADGVDLTLIRWMLSLSPLERLQVLQASAGSLERLREVARIES
jgi:hypothetical protein